MGITIKCGKSIETIKSVLEEIERKMPDVVWATGKSPTGWNPKIADNEDHVALFISDINELTFAKESKEYIDNYVSLNHANDTIIYADDFLSQSEEDIEIKNETDISFLFN